jgi:hypothetical protein
LMLGSTNAAIRMTIKVANRKERILCNAGLGHGESAAWKPWETATADPGTAAGTGRPRPGRRPS